MGFIHIPISARPPFFYLFVFPSLPPLLGSGCPSVSSFRAQVSHHHNDDMAGPALLSHRTCRTGTTASMSVLPSHSSLEDLSHLHSPPHPSRLKPCGYRRGRFTNTTDGPHPDRRQHAGCQPPRGSHLRTSPVSTRRSFKL
ncbi:hypothetical protein F5144DRAFT_553544 [Chaetomium tenue]|uniref:Uncharacterized protein n=1 Tax=Chaetomium tenue TaxID=1854479 RepID=A0ACB7PQM1_9PEZI|nr:hypothetical protein F5144DRAFT_553544 [Chaetomium globosum]